MSFAKPEITRTRVVAINPNTGKSKSFTIYGVTPEQFEARIRRQYRDEEGESGRPKPRQPPKESAPA